MSEIERGLKAPTLEKLDSLARAMGVHPLTLLTISYLANLREQDLEALQDRIRKEAKGLLAKAEMAKPQKARSR